MAKPYGRLLYAKRNGMDFPDWEMFNDMAAAIISVVIDVDTAAIDEKERKILKERAGVVTPRKPAMGYIIGRAITHIRSELRSKYNLIIDEKKSNVPGDQKVYRIFRREEVTGDVEHTPDQLLVFHKKLEAIIDDASSLDEDTRAKFDEAIKHVTTFTTWRDVRELADRAISACGAIRTQLGYIALPQVYDKVDYVTDILAMIGLEIAHFKIAPEDQSKTNELIKESLLDEINTIIEDVDNAVATLEKQKCIRDRLTTLERVRGRVALYSSVLEDVQESLVARITQAEESVNERLGDFA